MGTSRVVSVYIGVEDNFLLAVKFCFRRNVPSNVILLH
jgi:hypothetical protein